MDLNLDRFNEELENDYKAKEEARKFVKDVADFIEAVRRKYRGCDSRDKYRMAMKKLDHEVAGIFKEHPEMLTVRFGSDLMNLGMYATKYNLEESVLVALDNKEASLQQDLGGFNLGMYAVREHMEPAALKALENKEACKQESISGKTIESLYQEEFGKELTY